MTLDTAAAPPLVVDLDGTLSRTDLLLECFWKGMGSAPLPTLAVALRDYRHRARLKHNLGALAPVDVSTLPLRDEVLQLIDTAREAGREVLLVSGGTEALVEDFAARRGPFTEVLASDAETNLTRANKAARLIERFGEGGFDYVGDSPDDIPVWKAARKAYVVAPRPGFAARLTGEGIDAEPLGETWRPGDLLRALRPHQWLKNTLLALPLLAAHRAGLDDVLAVLWGFIAFSALASAIYIINDLTDLEADRVHDSKRERPFANGRLPIKVGMTTSLALAALGLGLGAALGPGMLAVLLVYLVATTAYSMHLKRVRWADVAMLAALYTLRVVAGAVAADVPASGWLFGFIFPVFLSLGCVKRLTELAKADGDGYVPGRRYRPSDRQDLANVAIVSAMAAVGVFLAYSMGPTAAALYAYPWVLWMVAALLGVWLARMIATGWTGQQDHDPIIYAITDLVGLALVVGSALLLLMAAG